MEEIDIMEKMISDLVGWSKGKRSGPSTITFNMVDGCNQKCRFCDLPYHPFIKKAHNPKIPDNNFLKDEDYYRFIREAAELKVDEIRFCGGGDPLFKKDRTMKMISLIKKYGMHCRLITNGTLFTERDIKNLVELGMDYIEFSIHGPDAATHDYLVRLPGAFDKVVHNIRRFNYWKQKLKKDKPRLRTCFTLNKVNYNKIEDMIRLCEKLKCSFLLRPLEIENEDDDQMKILVLNDNEKNIAKEKMKKIKIFKKTKIEISLPHKDGKFVTEIFNNKMKSEEKKSIEPDNFINSMCFEPWFNITIRDYRYFGACCRSIYSNLNKKNERKYKSLKDIWFGEYFEKMRKNSIKREFKDFCSACCNDFVNDDTVCISKKLKTMINQKK